MRRRWVYIQGEPVEVGVDYVADPRNHDAVLWNDRLYQDDNDMRYSSRSQHREFMRRSGLTTADDFKDEWKRAEHKRHYRALGIDPTRKREIAEAISKLEAGYKPRSGRED
jgi:hypothetical protein